jgi:D-alanyl-D-alanine carboxypeptidase (penicillin-binding protein 5/6)
MLAAISLSAAGTAHGTPSPPDISETTPVLPTPGTTLSPPPGAPFEQPVGGEQLGVVGIPVVDPEAAPLPEVDAITWLIADVDSGDVLAAKGAHEQRPPASTIKLLTALAAGPVLEDDQTYQATDEDAGIEGSRVGLAPGQTYTIDDILHGLMLASGNDAAHALGELAGGQDELVQMMNDTAARLGAFDTHAVTPHGLDSPGQLSSAYDLALIGRSALADERIAELAKTTSYEFPGLDGQVFQIQNQNRLLDSYDGAIGLKTGFTTQADHTLVAAAVRDERRLIAVVLGADGRGEAAATALLDWGFAQAGSVEAVGHLVTADEVAAATEGAADDGVLGDPIDDYERALSTPGATSGNVPDVVWLSLVVAVVAGGIGLGWRRRPRRSGRAGRYASRRTSS